eukprot:CAMPEP_0197575406 /NCGR_PEP_ID=MMETSP1326-20131121/816_1 /TAXON_ID=1155430 /ORGANISM="Genus nov. species nov., Strain RCC2288" /LENGTH=88 /DNA_ID=CAMNT_0043138167 /DNA_START=123 /DNA_END=389 /DNA_ORIENTATION=-
MSGIPHKNTQEEDDLLRARAYQSNKAVWKTLEPESDAFPKQSYSQEKLAYIPPAPGTVSTKHRNTKGIFGQFVDKAIRLKVNLKSTAH